MKMLSILILMVGIVLVSIGGFQLYKTELGQKDSLAEAKELIKDNSSNADLNEIESQPVNFDPQTGETTGILHIPKLEADLPIIEGTHEDELARGVGHYGGTAYPLQNEQIVLSGHRDTVFRSMGDLKIGDQLVMQMEYGDFTYEITETKIVDADDRAIIVPHHEEVLTLTTCYPFAFIGSAPDRYIIYAYPVDDLEE